MMLDHLAIGTVNDSVYLPNPILARIAFRWSTLGVVLLTFVN
jgi:uncharacterized membrane protein YciS (DUF1049 family)